MMRNFFDLVVIGGGPAGLMAAKTAAERKLEVLLFEKRKRIPQVKRTCCCSFYLEPNYMGETTQVEEGKLVFPKNGFTVNYAGSLYPIKEKYGISKGGYKWHMVRFESEDYSKDTPLSMVLDKEVLLEGLLNEVENLGVTVMNGSMVKKMENTEKGVKVEAAKAGQSLLVEGKKAIVADGVNSRMVESIGFNKERKVLGARAVFLEYLMEGVDNPFPHAVLNFHGEKISKFGPLFLWPNSKGLPRIMVMSRFPNYPSEVINDFISESPYASWFKDARIIGKTAGSLVPRAAISDPHIGNILIIGDAAAFIEVENQGAMMCGFQAGNAVCEELNGSDGFKRYLEWWRHSFEFNHPELLRAMTVLPAIEARGYRDEDIDYLFSVVDGEDIYGTTSQYRSGVAIWKAILEHSDTIKKERPALYEKIKGLLDLNLEDIWEPTSKTN
jgi:digeranylgeranylglycerophospholipid reductase